MRALATSQPLAAGRKRQAPARVTPALAANTLFPPVTATPLLQRKPGCACGGGCPRCQLQSLQPKLRIGQPNDKYEQEADRVADMVMRMSEPTVQRQPLEEEEEEEEILQTKPLADQITPLVQRQVGPPEQTTLPGTQSAVSPNLQHRITALQGHGHPLSQSEREFFEPRFGAEFSQVRIHADRRAGETANAVNARAFTLGHDIVMGVGQYSPGNSERRRLLAHELTHVVQQNGGQMRHGVGRFAIAPHRASVNGKPERARLSFTHPTPEIQPTEEQLRATPPEGGHGTEEAPIADLAVDPRGGITQIGQQMVISYRPVRRLQRVNTVLVNSAGQIIRVISQQTRENRTYTYTWNGLTRDNTLARGGPFGIQLTEGRAWYPRRVVWASPLLIPAISVTAPFAAGLNTPSIRLDLARILHHEMRNGDEAEKLAIIHIAVNNMVQINTADIRDVVRLPHASGSEPFAINLATISPARDLVDLVDQVLPEIIAGQISDSTGGATQYFSPRTMPGTADRGCCLGEPGPCSMHRDDFHCGGGLQTVPGTSERRYFPNRARGHTPRPVPSTNPMNILVF